MKNLFFLFLLFLAINSGYAQDTAEDPINTELKATLQLDDAQYTQVKKINAHAQTEAKELRKTEENKTLQRIDTRQQLRTINQQRFQSIEKVLDTRQQKLFKKWVSERKK